MKPASAMRRQLLGKVGKQLEDKLTNSEKSLRSSHAKADRLAQLSCLALLALILLSLLAGCQAFSSESIATDQQLQALEGQSVDYNNLGKNPSGVVG